ncbi:MAG: hypothetical protein H8E11_07260, partial [Candidatus Cloacimonetes bacterium]|nr:hypothetical protein [Candidatus Cloacimonadota bacterium]
MKQEKMLITTMSVILLFVPIVFNIEVYANNIRINKKICVEFRQLPPPPTGYWIPIARIPDSRTVKILPNVPAFDWCYGCSPTSAAMMAGYYDKTDYPNMYSGPTYCGVIPKNNSVWGYGECPLSATHQGYDGLSQRGHVDDYWYSSGSNIDPYIYYGWTEHTQGDCTGDYMGTSQYYNWLNMDGSTRFYYYIDGSPLCDYTGCEPDKKDGCHGLRQFFESCGYTVDLNCTQLIYGWNGNTQGFTFDDYKGEIDVGRPVLIHVKQLSPPYGAHTMLCYGYNTSGSIIYIHDTWDHNNHEMTWGGTYPYPSGALHHKSVTVIHLEEIAVDEVKLTASDGADDDEFGSSVSICGDYSIVGVPWDDDNGNASGSAYIFQRFPPNGSSWIQQEKLNASDGSAHDLFGKSVFISYEYAIVGAVFDDDNGSNSGSAYIFKRNGSNWTQQEKLTASDGNADDNFGCSVSMCGDYAISSAPMCGDYAIIGSSGDDDNGNASGSVYIFKRNGSSWIQQAKLTPDDGAEWGFFGCSVCISDKYTVIGSFGDCENGIHSGAAYIFKRNGNSWNQQAKLTASDGTAHDNFGKSVSIFDNYAIVGAPEDDDNGNASGSAYIFKRNGSSWMQQAKLTASDAAQADNFGESVSISGDYAIVGASENDDNGTASGSVYFYLRSIGEIWTEKTKLTASDGAYWDHFGESVSVSGGYIIVGADEDDDNGYDSGSAYICHLPLFSRSGENYRLADKLPQTNYKEIIPTELMFSSNYPNPFNSITTIRYSIYKKEDIQITIY